MQPDPSPKAESQALTSANASSGPAQPSRSDQKANPLFHAAAYGTAGRIGDLQAPKEEPIATLEINLGSEPPDELVTDISVQPRTGSKIAFTQPDGGVCIYEVTAFVGPFIDVDGESYEVRLKWSGWQP